MSDAEATVKHAIFDGMIKRHACSPEEAVDAIFEAIFAESVRWAVVVYLKELAS